MPTMTELKRQDEARRAAEKAAFGPKQPVAPVSTVPNPSQPVISPLDRLPVQPMQLPKIEEKPPIEAKKISPVELSAGESAPASPPAGSRGGHSEEPPAPPPPPPPPPPEKPTTIVIDGVTYGIGKPLPGMFEYYDPEIGMKRAGAYVPANLPDVAQPSTELNNLVDKLMKEGNLTNQQVLDLIYHYESGGVKGDMWAGSEVLNKNPHLSEILRDELKGKAWEDTRNGVMVVATEAGGTADKPALTTTMLLSPEKVKELNKLSEKEQFEELKKLGVYPSDYEWVKYTTPDGKTTEGFYTGEQVKALEEQGHAESQLRHAGAIDAEGRLDVLKAVQAGITDPKVFRDAGFKVNPGDIDDMQGFIASNISLSGHWYSKAEMEEFQKEEPELYDILATKGYKAYEDALNKSNLIKITNWAKENLLKGHPDPKYVAAENLIKEWRNPDGSYNVIHILQGATSLAETNAEKKKYVDAVELLFKEEDLKEIRYKWPGLFLYSNRKQTEAERKQQLEDIASGKYTPEVISTKLTPDQEEKATEIMTSDLSGFQKIKALKAAGIPMEPGSDSMQAIMASLPVALVNAAGYTKNTPMPQDDMIALIVLGAIGTGAAIVNAVKNFRSDNNRAPTVANIITIDGNKFSSIRPGEFDNGWIIDTVPFFKLPTLEQNFPPRVDTNLPSDIPPRVDLSELMQFLQSPEKVDLWWPTPAYQQKAEDFILASENMLSTGGTLGQKVQTIELPIDYNEILKNAQRDRIFKELNRAIGVEINRLNQIVRNTEVGRRLADELARSATSGTPLIREANQPLTSYLRTLYTWRDEIERRLADDIVKSQSSGTSIYRPSKDINELIQDIFEYGNAHQEYLKKLAIWKEAWKSYVDSVHPEPIKGGSLGLAQRSMLAMTLLKGAKGDIFPDLFDTGLKRGHMEEIEMEEMEEIETETEREPALEVQAAQRQRERLLTRVVTRIGSRYQTELNRLTRAYGKTITKLQLQTAQQTALKNALEQATQIMTQTQTQTLMAQDVRTLTQSLEKTLPSELTNEVVREAVEEAVDELTKEAARTTEMTGELTAEAELTTTDETFKKNKDEDEEKKRSEIKESLGAFNYIRGKLQDKPVNHTWYVDKKGQLKRAIVIGAPPEGAKNVTGKKSASLSLTKIRGRRLPEFRIVEDTGASDTVITSHNGKLTIDFTGDITGHPRISEHVGPITERPGRISGKIPRISTRTSRISGRTPRLR